MDRFRRLSGFRKCIVLTAAVMTLLFTVLYVVNTGKEGFAYRETLLIPEETSGGTVYAGEIKGEDVSFTVKDKTVEFRHGEKRYGPYTAKEDPTAIPELLAQSEAAKGIELRCGEEVIFRGCMWRTEEGETVLIREDGTPDFGMSVGSDSGVTVSQDGKITDTWEPSAQTVLTLMEGPAHSRRGSWIGWAIGTFACILAAVSALFWDEIFRWNLKFVVRNAEGAEPADWMIATRYISWAVFLMLALFSFIYGLRQIV